MVCVRNLRGGTLITQLQETQIGVFSHGLPHVHSEPNLRALFWLLNLAVVLPLGVFSLVVSISYCANRRFPQVGLNGLVFQ